VEFEDVSAEIEREAWRIVAAFGSTSYVSTPQFHSEIVEFTVTLESEVTLGLYLNTTPIVTVGLIELSGCGAFLFMAASSGGRWEQGGVDIHFTHHSRMARGFYCLGIEDEATWRQLLPLSAHEKLELRLSMPREFWPQKWLDEEGEPDMGA
jgi:hypothetical protein